MIEPASGDLLRSDAEALVNTVNCVGYMGRGIALQFKRAFPDNFKVYEKACKRHELEPGKMLVYETGQLTGPKFIINFPTKRHWRGASRIEDIDAGLAALVAEIRARHIKSIAVPPLGAGLGGLDWSAVRPRIVRALGALEDVRVLLYDPHGPPPADAIVKASKRPKMTAGRAALVELIRRYLAGLLDPTVSLLEVHKLLYFLQAAGEGLRLDYKKALYGPYAENLRHVLNAVEGYFVAGYADGGDRPDKELTLVPGAVADAERALASHEDTRERLARVGTLVDGFESAFGLELLATVHWVAHQEGARSADEAVTRVYEWNERKRQFSEAQIRLAWRTLDERGWLSRAAA